MKTPALLAKELLKWADSEEQGVHLAYLVAGTDVLLCCSEDPTLEDARKCFKACLKAIAGRK